MNVNEVIANRANERLGGAARRQTAGSSQRSRQSTASRRTIAFRPPSISPARWRKSAKLLPVVAARCIAALAAKSEAFAAIMKIGRTHLQDATPVTLGQEFSGYAAQARLRRRANGGGSSRSLALAQGGTAVGTGLNTAVGSPGGFAARIAAWTEPAFRHRAE